MRAFRQLTGAGMAVIYLWTNVIAAHAAESNFWAERRRRAQQTNPSSQQNYLASAALTPAKNGLSPDQEKVLAGLPQVSQLNFAATGPSPAPSLASLSDSLKNSLPKEPASSREIPTWLSKIISPYGSVREIHLAKSANAPLVVHIQDAHGIEDAQRNMASIIETVANAAGPKTLIGVEGASGKFDLAPYRNFTDPGITRDIADYFLKEGFIGAPEFAGLTATQPPTLMGLEDVSLYEGNIRAFKDSLPEKTEADNILRGLKSASGALKEKTYSTDLQQFDRHFSAYKNRTEGLGPYVKYLMSVVLNPSLRTDLARNFHKSDNLRNTVKGPLASLTQSLTRSISPSISYPNTAILLQALSLEDRLDFKQVEQERLRLVEALVKQLSQQQISLLIQESLRYRAAQMSYAQYYEFLRDLCRRNGIDLKKFGPLNDYVDYVLLAEKIDRNKLLNEISTLETSVQDQLATVPAQKRLVAANRNILLLEKLFNHSMTMADWRDYDSDREKILGVDQELDALATDLGLAPEKPAERNPLTSDFIRPFEDFCRAATLRNAAFVDNLTKALPAAQNGGPRLAVLVAGGFHSDGLAEILRRKDISYMVVTPKIAEVPKDNNYLDIFARDPLPLEKIFEGEKIYLVYPLRFGTAMPGYEQGQKQSKSLFIGMQTVLQNPAANKAFEFMTGWMIVNRENMDAAALDRISQRKVISIAGHQLIIGKVPGSVFAQARGFYLNRIEGPFVRRFFPNLTATAGWQERFLFFSPRWWMDHARLLWTGKFQTFVGIGFVVFATGLGTALAVFIHNHAFAALSVLLPVFSAGPLSILLHGALLAYGFFIGAYAIIPLHNIANALSQAYNGIRPQSWPAAPAWDLSQAPGGPGSNGLPTVRKSYNDLGDLNRDVMLLEKAIDAAGLDNLPKLGFHGEMAGHQPFGDFWYFLLDTQLDEYWTIQDRVAQFDVKIKLMRGTLRISDVFMPSAELFERLQGTVIFTSRYGKMDISLGEFPEIYILAEAPDKQFKLVVKHSKKPTESSRVFDPIKNELKDFRFLFLEGKEKSEEIPPEAVILRAGISPEEFSRVQDWIARQAFQQPNAPALAAEFFVVRLLYKKVLEEILQRMPNGAESFASVSGANTPEPAKESPKGGDMTGLAAKLPPNLPPAVLDILFGTVRGPGVDLPRFDLDLLRPFMNDPAVERWLHGVVNALPPALRPEIQAAHPLDILLGLQPQALKNIFQEKVQPSLVQEIRHAGTERLGINFQAGELQPLAPVNPNPDFWSNLFHIAEDLNPANPFAALEGHRIETPPDEAGLRIDGQAAPQRGIWKFFDGLVRRGRKPQSPGSTNGGLIGKYEILSQPVFDKAAGEVRFTARHVETNEVSELAIPAKAASSFVSLEDFLPSLVHSQNELVSMIVDWFEENYSGDLVILSANPYGIHGIGTDRVIGVSSDHENDPIAWFHEIAEAMGAAGELPRSYLVSFLRDRTWYDAHVSKPGREGMELHYAIRAFQREAFSTDVDLTFGLKGRLTRREIDEVLARSGLKYPRRLLREFRMRRLGVSTKEQELQLLDELIAQLAQRDAQEEAARQLLDGKQRDRARIAQILKDTEDYLEENIKALELFPDEIEEVKEHTVRMLSDLKTFDRDSIAGIVSDRLKQETRGVHAAFVNLLLEKFIPALDEAIVARVLIRLLSEMQSKKSYAPEKTSLTLAITEIVSHIPAHATDTVMQDIAAPLVSYLRDTLSEKPFIHHSQADGIPDLYKYFVESGRPGILYFREDYSRRIKFVRDINQRRQLERLYKLAIYDQERAKEIGWHVLVQDKGMNVAEQLLLELESGALNETAAAEIIRLMADHWPKDSSDPRYLYGSLVKAIIGLYRRNGDGEIRKDLLKSFATLSTHSRDLSDQREMVSFIRSIQKPFFDEITRIGQRIADLDAGMPTETRKEQSARYQQMQYQLMDEMEDRVKILVEVAKVATSSTEAAQKQFGEELVRTLLQTADQEAESNRWDRNITAAILSQLSSLAEAGNPDVVHFFVERVEPTMAQDRKQLLERLTGDGTADRDILSALRRKRFPLSPRAAYLLLLRFKDRRKLLERVIRDNNIDVRFRIYAFTHFIAQYAFDDMSGLLADGAEKLLRESLASGVTVNNLFQDIPLQNEEAKVYATAVLLTMQKHLPYISAKGFVRIARAIQQTQVKDFWGNADAGFVLGGALFKRRTLNDLFFLQVMAHEIMHNILFAEYGYDAKTLTSGMLHEFMSDIYAFAFSGIMGKDTQLYRAQVDYEEHFADVARDSFNAVESHEGARAQLAIIDEALAAKGLTLDPQKAVKAGLEVLSRNAGPELAASELIQMILRKYMGEPDSPPDQEIIKAKGKISSVDLDPTIDVDDRDLKQEIMHFSETSLIFFRVFPNSIAYALAPFVMRLPLPQSTKLWLRDHRTAIGLAGLVFEIPALLIISVHPGALALKLIFFVSFAALHAALRFAENNRTRAGPAADNTIENMSALQRVLFPFLVITVNTGRHSIGLAPYIILSALTAANALISPFALIPALMITAAIHASHDFWMLSPNFRNWATNWFGLATDYIPYNEEIKTNADTYTHFQRFVTGGFGKLYTCENSKGETVVLKIARVDDRAREALENERAIMKKLDHPGIVRLLDEGSYNALPFLVMPRIQGEEFVTLNFISSDFPDPRETVRLFLEVLDAMAYMHQRGIVHFDLNPWNIMISGGHAMVIDLGVANLRSYGREKNPYIAPELKTGDGSPQSDIYAAGAMLQKAFARYAGLYPELFGRIKPVWKKASRLNPAERYSSAEEMKAALEEAVGQTAVPRSVDVGQETNALPADDLPYDARIQGGAGAYTHFQRLSADTPSRVYKCVNANGDVVVLKIAQDSTESREIINHERAMMEKLPGLEIKLLDHGDYEGVPFFIMPYFEGDTLASLVSADRLPADPRQTIQWFIEILDQLAYMHQRYSFHLDVTPQNILVTAGRATLLDLGIAMDYREPRLNGTINVQYGAPEQQYGIFWPQSDIYSLGVVLEETFALYAKTAPEIRQAIKPIWEKAAQEDFNQRYSSARQMKEALQTAVAGQSSAAAEEEGTPNSIAFALHPFLALAIDRLPARFNGFKNWFAAHRTVIGLAGLGLEIPALLILSLHPGAFALKLLFFVSFAALHSASRYLENNGARAGPTAIASGPQSFSEILRRLTIDTIPRLLLFAPYIILAAAPSIALMALAVSLHLYSDIRAMGLSKRLDDFILNRTIGLQGFLYDAVFNQKQNMTAGDVVMGAQPGDDLTYINDEGLRFFRKYNPVFQQLVEEHGVEILWCKTLRGAIGQFMIGDENHPHFVLLDKIMVAREVARLMKDHGIPSELKGVVTKIVIGSVVTHELSHGRMRGWHRSLIWDAMHTIRWTINPHFEEYVARQEETRFATAAMAGEDLLIPSLAIVDATTEQEVYSSQELVFRNYFSVETPDRLALPQFYATLVLKTVFLAAAAIILLWQALDNRHFIGKLVNPFVFKMENGQSEQQKQITSQLAASGSDGKNAGALNSIAFVLHPFFMSIANLLPLPQSTKLWLGESRTSIGLAGLIFEIPALLIFSVHPGAFALKLVFFISFAALHAALRYYENNLTRAGPVAAFKQIARDTIPHVLAFGPYLILSIGLSINIFTSAPLLSPLNIILAATHISYDLCLLSPTFRNWTLYLFGLASNDIPYDAKIKIGSETYTNFQPITSENIDWTNTNIVYKCENSKGEAMVLKISEVNWRSMITLVQERSLMKKLNHPGIVPLIDEGTYKGVPFLIMPYLEGGTLLAVNHQQNPRQTIEWLIEVMDAVAYMHQRKIIHRDLEFRNIMISGGHPIVIDLGAAIEQGKWYKPDLMGKGLSLDRRNAVPQSDINALGRLLDEIFGPYRSPYDLFTVIKPILEKSAQKDPSKGYSSVEEMRAALEKAVGQTSNAPKPRAETSTGRTQFYALRLPTPDQFHGIRQTNSSGFFGKNRSVWKITLGVVGAALLAVTLVVGQFLHRPAGPTVAPIATPTPAATTARAPTATAAPTRAPTPTATRTPAPTATATPVFPRGPIAFQNVGFRQYKLIVNGREKTLVGMGYNMDYSSLPQAEQRARMDKDFAEIRDLGINSIITWGHPAQGTPKGEAYMKLMLDESEKYLGDNSVVLGYWLDPNGNWTNAAYRNDRLKEMERFFSNPALKDHPALLFWSPGNEIFIGTGSGAQKIAFAQWYDQLMELAMKDDPKHPVLYHDANATGLLLLLDNSPRFAKFGVYGANSYGGIDDFLAAWSSGALAPGQPLPPLLFAEYGPNDPTEGGRDTRQYVTRANLIYGAARQDQVLGAFVHTWGMGLYATGDPAVIAQFALHDANGNPLPILKELETIWKAMPTQQAPSNFPLSFSAPMSLLFDVFENLSGIALSDTWKAIAGGAIESALILALNPILSHLGMSLFWIHALQIAIFPALHLFGPLLRWKKSVGAAEKVRYTLVSFGNRDVKYYVGLAWLTIAGGFIHIVLAPRSLLIHPFYNVATKWLPLPLGLTATNAAVAIAPDRLTNVISSLYADSSIKSSPGFFAGDSDFSIDNALGVFRLLNIKPTDTVLEIGPGFTRTAIAAALLGARVTVIESPEVLRYSRYERLVALWQSEIEKAGGKIDRLEGDVTDASFRRGFAQKDFDHIIALDVLNPHTDIPPGEEEHESAAMRRFAGITDNGAVKTVVDWLLSIKKPNTGSLYLSHGETSAGPKPALLEIVGRGLAKFGMRPQNSINLPIPRHYVASSRAGIVYQFGDGSFGNPAYSTVEQRRALAGPTDVLAGEIHSWLELTDHIQIQFADRASIQKNFLEPEINGDEYSFLLPEDLTVRELMDFAEVVRSLSEISRFPFRDLVRRMAALRVFLIQRFPNPSREIGDIVEALFLLATKMSGRPPIDETFEALMGAGDSPDSSMRSFANDLGLKWTSWEEQDAGDITKLASHALLTFARVYLEAITYTRGLAAQMEKMKTAGKGKTLREKIKFDELAAILESAKGEPDPAARKTRVLAAEKKVIQSILDEIALLPGWKYNSHLEASPRMGTLQHSLNCVGRSALMAQYLSELGLEVFAADVLMFHNSHICLLARLADDSYWWIEPSGEGFTLNNGPITLPKSFLEKGSSIVDVDHWRLKRIQITPWQIGVLSGLYTNVGVNYFKIGESALAIDYLFKATVINPRYVRGHLNLGYAYMMAGAKDKALASFEKVLKLDPQSAEAYYYKGLVYQNLQQNDVAVSFYAKAIDINRRFADAYLRMGIAQQAQQSYNEAIASYKNAVKFYQKEPKPNPNLALAEKYLEQAQREKSSAGSAVSRAADSLSYLIFKVLGVRGWKLAAIGVAGMIAESAGITLSMVFGLTTPHVMFILLFCYAAAHTSLSLDLIRPSGGMEPFQWSAFLGRFLLHFVILLPYIFIPTLQGTSLFGDNFHMPRLLPFFIHAFFDFYQMRPLPISLLQRPALLLRPSNFPRDNAAFEQDAFNSPEERIAFAGPHRNVDSWLLLTDHDEAITWYNELLKRDKDKIPAIFALAYSYYEIGDYDQAVTNYQRVLELDPSHGPAKRNLRVALIEQKSKNDAGAPNSLLFWIAKARGASGGWLVFWGLTGMLIETAVFSKWSFAAMGSHATMASMMAFMVGYIFLHVFVRRSAGLGWMQDREWARGRRPSPFEFFVRDVAPHLLLLMYPIAAISASAHLVSPVFIGFAAAAHFIYDVRIILRSNDLTLRSILVTVFFASLNVTLFFVERLVSFMTAVQQWLNGKIKERETRRQIQSFFRKQWQSYWFPSAEKTMEEREADLLDAASNINQLCPGFYDQIASIRNFFRAQVDPADQNQVDSFSLQGRTLRVELDRWNRDVLIPNGVFLDIRLRLSVGSRNQRIRWTVYGEQPSVFFPTEETLTYNRLNRNVRIFFGTEWKRYNMDRYTGVSFSDQNAVLINLSAVRDLADMYVYAMADVRDVMRTSWSSSPFILSATGPGRVILYDLIHRAYGFFPTRARERGVAYMSIIGYFYFRIAVWRTSLEIQANTMVHEVSHQLHAMHYISGVAPLSLNSMAQFLGEPQRPEWEDIPLDVIWEVGAYLAELSQQGQVPMETAVGLVTTFLYGEESATKQAAGVILRLLFYSGTYSSVRREVMEQALNDPTNASTPITFLRRLEELFYPMPFTSPPLFVIARRLTSHFNLPVFVPRESLLLRTVRRLNPFGEKRTPPTSSPNSLPYLIAQAAGLEGRSLAAIGLAGWAFEATAAIALVPMAFAAPILIAGMGIFFVLYSLAHGVVKAKINGTRAGPLELLRLSVPHFGFFALYPISALFGIAFFANPFVILAAAAIHLIYDAWTISYEDVWVSAMSETGLNLPTPETRDAYRAGVKANLRELAEQVVLGGPANQINWDAARPHAVVQAAASQWISMAHGDKINGATLIIFDINPKTLAQDAAQANVIIGQLRFLANAAKKKSAADRPRIVLGSETAEAARAWLKTAEPALADVFNATDWKDRFTTVKKENGKILVKPLVQGHEKELADIVAFVASDGAIDPRGVNVKISIVELWELSRAIQLFIEQNLFYLKQA